MADQPVQNSLTALVPIKAALVDGLREKLKTNPLDPTALDEVGTVHFARIFVVAADNASGVPSSLAAVITAYDGNFARYIQDFVNSDHVAAFFDELLMAIDDPSAAGMVPVQKHAAAFAGLVQKYDLTNPSTEWGQWYSAYPTKTVQNILHP